MGWGHSNPKDFSHEDFEDVDEDGYPVKSDAKSGDKKPEDKEQSGPQ